MMGPLPASLLGKCGAGCKSSELATVTVWSVRNLRSCSTAMMQKVVHWTGSRLWALVVREAKVFVVLRPQRLCRAPGLGLVHSSLAARHFCMTSLSRRGEEQPLAENEAEFLERAQASVRTRLAQDPGGNSYLHRLRHLPWRVAGKAGKFSCPCRSCCYPRCGLYRLCLNTRCA